MVNLRPHILTWTVTSEATEDDNGYPIPGAATTYQIPCRWRSGGTKQFRNEDNSLVNQKGRIQVDRGSQMPQEGQLIEVVGYFKGVVIEPYSGAQLTRWRIDV